MLVYASYVYVGHTSIAYVYAKTTNWYVFAPARINRWVSKHSALLHAILILHTKETTRGYSTSRKNNFATSKIKKS